jgi:hypothetical protein
VVAVSSVVRIVAAWLRQTPAYFPDEYMYAEFSRSLAAGHMPAVRGVDAHFLPFLQPLLTAPAWLLPSVEAGFRAAQAIDAVAMSLAAVPVYLLARRVGLSSRLAIAAATLSLTLPSLLYSSFIMSEPFAYPIVLGVLAAAVHALDRPGWRSYVIFLALTGVAMFARMQFAVIIPCFVLALVIVVVRERRVREFVRSHRIHIALLLVVSAALFAVGPARNTGYYPSLGFIPGFNLSTAARILAADALVLVFACGFVIVPGAVLGVGLGILRPRGRAELAFAAMTLVFTIALLLQAVVYGHLDYIQERYLFYVLPLWTISFLLYAQRGWPRRTAHALVSVALLVAALLIPLTRYIVADANSHSAFLFALRRLAEMLSVKAPSTASLVIVLAAAGAVAVVLLVSFLRPRAATPVAIALALAATTAASVGAASYDVRNTRWLHALVLGSDPTWVDHANVGPTSMLLLPGTRSTDAFLFWNRSIDRLVLFPGVVAPDSFALDRSEIKADGTVLVSGRPLRGPMVIANRASAFQLRDATILKSSAGHVLVRPRASLRLGLLAIGRYSDGWLDESGYIFLWPSTREGAVSGRFILPVRPPSGSSRETTLRFTLPSGDVIERHAAPGRVTNVVVPVCSNAATLLRYAAGPAASVGDGRNVVATTGMPRFVPSRGRCN